MSLYYIRTYVHVCPPLLLHAHTKVPLPVLLNTLSPCTPYKPFAYSVHHYMITGEGIDPVHSSDEEDD